MRIGESGSSHLVVCIVNEWTDLLSCVVEVEDLDKFKHNLDTHWNARQYL